MNEDEDDEDLYRYVESIENMLLMNDEVEHKLDFDKSSELDYNRNIYKNEEPENKGSSIDVTSPKDVTETEKEKGKNP